MRKGVLLAAIALSLVLLGGCGGSQQENNENNDLPSAPAVETDKIVPKPAQTPHIEPEKQPEESVPDEHPDQAADVPETPPPADPKPELEPEPEEIPVQSAESMPEAQTGPAIPADGSYTAAVTLEGGTGRASVESPARLRCENGEFWATIVWSSPNYDYMKVDGVQYNQINTEGNSVFEIPVAAFDQKLDVLADTTAMSEPHEVAYTLTFDSASLQAA